MPSTLMPYVPSAAMLVRRSSFPGFDESLRVAEDVDLCWRLHGAGWRLRYDPVARGPRPPHRNARGARTSPLYGTGAAYLADRHQTLPRRSSCRSPWPPPSSRCSPVPPRHFLAVAMLLLGQMAVRLRRRLDGLPQAPLVAARMTGRAAGFGLLQAGGDLPAHYGPIALVPTLFSADTGHWSWRVAIAEGLIDWTRRFISEPGVRPALGPVGYVIMRRLDDLAYGLGLWRGDRPPRSEALRPVLSK